MARKKSDDANVPALKAEVREQPITDTLESNYMPYAMSAIVSRAIPEIDGFKPSHRKLLYTMYKMNLTSRTKSSNIVGQTMKLNPHGDGPIYETMVRLSVGYEALNTPFVDSKGNFGKVYSRDMAYAAARYTEARLSAVCDEIFRDIDKDTVDFADNYDGTTKEPTLLPTVFPNVLASANLGIAVGMASRVCGFNLVEVCRATIEYIADADTDLSVVMPAPDFPTGGEILYDADEMDAIYRTGRGGFKLRARWRYLKKENIIEVYEIPYSTTIEAIVDKTAELVRSGKIKEIADMRDETDLNGLKIAIELKRGVDSDKLMQKLFKQTTLQDTFSCNFNILIGGMPRVMGVREILDEWVAWRQECVRRRVYFDLGKSRERLHLMRGLEKILLNIDKAIAIIRGTERESDVVPNLMTGFEIDRIQADYVAEIRLRNINREYILKRVNEIAALEKEIADLENILSSKRRISGIIVSELKDVIKKYPAPRKTGIVQASDAEEYDTEELPDDYPVTVFLSREGYFKKITPQSLRMSAEQKYKDDDGSMQSFAARNNGELLIFTDRQQVYKLRIRDVADSKASVLGDYLPSLLVMDDGEAVIGMLDPGGYDSELVLLYENGKGIRLPLSVYATKTNRKRLTKAYSDKSPLKAILPLSGDMDITIFGEKERALVFNSSFLRLMTSRVGAGVAVLSAKYRLTEAVPLEGSGITNVGRYRAKSLPAAGAPLRPEDRGEEQLSLL